MKVQITEYERCQTMNVGSIEDHLIGITKPSIDRMLKMENPGDCIALYTFYCYTRKWQKNNAVFATSDYAMTALGWGRDKFSKAKAQLKEAGFIEDVLRRNENGRVEGWYVGVRFAQSATLAETRSLDIPHCGETAPKYLGIVNEIPNTSKQIQENGSSPKQQTIDFEQGAIAHPTESNDSNSRPPKTKAVTSRASRKSPPQKPDDVTEGTWQAWCEMRKTKQASVSTPVINLLRNEADKAGWSLDSAMQECVLRNWQGFKAAWLEKAYQQEKQSKGI